MTTDATEAPQSDPERPEDRAAADAAVGSPAPVVVARWVQLVLLPLAVLALYALARAAGVVLLVFLVAAVIALILNPLVRLWERTRLPHGLAVAAVYVGLLLAFVGATVLLVNPVSEQVSNFQRDVPRLVREANASLSDVQDWLDDRDINIEVKAQGSTALETLRKNVLEGSGSIVDFTSGVLQRLVGAGFALVLVLVISIYMLLYGREIGRLVRNVMPPGDGTPEDDFPLGTQKAVSSYVRGQLLFSVIMGTTAGIALWIFGALGIFPDGRTYALFFGAFFGVMELIPYLGPVLGAVPPVLVALFQDPLTAVWVALLFLALQQIEGHIVAPQVFGNALRINPLLVIFALLFGGEAYGIIGAFIALPIAAVARETVVYLRRHVVFEPWTQPLGVAGGGGGAAIPGPGPPPRTCVRCGASAAPDDAFCRTCGAELRE
jgi:predicted PurR-regulated permease PerM